MTDIADLSPTAQAALTEVRRHGVGVSFIEIVNAIRAAGIDPDGTVDLCMTGDSNVVYWSGINRDVADAITSLLRARLVHMTPTQPITYFIDGIVPTLPVAQRRPRAGYKEPHWAPMVINDGPGKTGSSRQ